MSLMPVEEAKAQILAGAAPLATEEIPITSAHARVLAKDLKARRNQPPFDASAMDGYAVNSADAVAGAELKLIGVSAAGHGFRKALGRGQTVRIFTGAPVPASADAILIQENAAAVDASVSVKAAVKPGQHIRPRGLDFKKGDTLLSAGQRLSARDIGLAAAMNLSHLPVRRKPVVAILATGDELVEPGSRPAADQISSSNNLALSAFVEWAGGLTLNLGTVKDSVREIRAAIRRAKNADVLVTSGGASVGEHDLVRKALEEENFSLAFWKVAMRPGKPLMFARNKRQRIIGLPGNPVSALVCARVFIKPLIDRFLGIAEEESTRFATLAAPMRANDERQEYARGKLAREKDGSFSVMPFPVQDSSILALLARADCLIIRPPRAPAAGIGEKVEIMPIDF
jgi:molybdopterin molybdotransferase